MNRLVLIDGNAILHRAYHALPPMTSPEGTPVNAVYGFVSMLVKLVHDLHPTHLAVAFDRPAPTFRKELYAAYQATRPEMEADLAVQIDVIHAFTRAIPLAVYEQDGYEADDIIGTLATQAGAHGIDQVIIITGDRDILQLVNDERILVLMPVKGLGESKLYDSRAVRERLGVDPGHIVDYKALAGDASDNYPGVAGIGPKTAADLINRYQTIENIYTTLKQGGEDIKEGIRSKLREGEQAAVLSKTLARIKTDVPLAVDWKTLAFTTLVTPGSTEMLSQLHFHSLLKRLQAGGMTETPPTAKRRSGKKKPTGEDTTQLSLV